MLEGALGLLGQHGAAQGSFPVMRWELAIYFCFSAGFGARKTGGAQDAITFSDGFR